MKSPLNISKTAKRYDIDKEPDMMQQLINFDKFIWQDSSIETVEKLPEFEKEYQKYSKDFDFCFDTEIKEFLPIDMHDGKMDLLCRGAFQRTSKSKSELYEKFINEGLNELESVVIMTFLADISGIYRKDAYPYGIPPFAQEICKILNNAISKLPTYSETVVRACNDYDKIDFKIGEIFSPGFCLTCSADCTWEDKSKNRYKITPLKEEQTKARKIFAIHDISEKQVTFLQDASFRITGIKNWGNGKKQIEMQEI